MSVINYVYITRQHEILESVLLNECLLCENICIKIR